MTTKEEIMSGIDAWIDDTLSQVVGNNPLMKLVQPTVKRYIKNYIGKYEHYIDGLADKDGKIDFEGIFDETVQQFKTMDKMPLHTDIGNINIGQGEIGMVVPVLGKEVSINYEDLMQLKDLIIYK